MFKLFFILLFFCTIISLNHNINAQVANCDYSYEFNWGNLIKITNIAAYSCNLNTKKSSANKKITKIDGQHLLLHSDINVKNLINFKNHILKKFSSIFCQKFPNLELIRIADAQLETIDEDSLVNCKSLTNLLLDGNKIKNLPDYLLTSNSELIRLWLWNNNLKTLLENSFLNQHKLEIFELQGNEIENLKDSKWMKNLQNLRRLGLNSNKIEEIPSKTFKSLINLDQLWIYDNKVKKLHSDSFEGLEYLELLSLSKNQLTDLPAGVFEPLVNLKKLYISNNKLTVVSSNWFGTHNQLISIDLQDNKINSIDEKFIDKTAIGTLNMANNICSSSHSKNRADVKLDLRNCFNNYQNTIQPQKQLLNQPQTQPRTQPRTQPQAKLQTQPLKETIRIDLNPSKGTSCGKSKTGHGNIIGGAQIRVGDFPWIAALMTPLGKFFCGGTLVSSRKVITAAHCIQEKRSIRRLSANDIIVVLGAHDLKQFIEVGRVFHAVYSINVHPDWNIFTQSYDADIAILVLEKDVAFNEYIQPICLSVINTAISTGIVVGYGKSEDESKSHENIPKMIEMPIHKNKDCFAENENLALIASGRTFCGGSGNGTGVCVGDSGSGLVFNDGSASYLLGIVSSSLLNARRGCDVDTYAVFTDVLKFADWIDTIQIDRFAEGSK